MNIKDAYTKGLELVFVSECSRWSMYVTLCSDDGKGGLQLLLLYGNVTPL